MLSPPDNLVDGYLALLAAQLKSLPVAARDEHLRELRQHIEQLVAAHAGQSDAVQSALSHMGDPKRIGRRLAGEWRFQHTQTTIGYFLLYWGIRGVVALVFSLWNSHIIDTRPFAEWGGSHSVLYDSIRELAVVLVSSLVLGWFAPGCAFRIAFYGWLWLSGEVYVSALAIYGHQISFFHSGYFYRSDAYSTSVLPLLAPLTVLASFMVQCGVAYLVSAYRRGELYPLRPADFRIPFYNALREKLARRK